MYVCTCPNDSERLRANDISCMMSRVDRDDDRASIDPRSQWIIRFVPSSHCVNVVIIWLSACNRGCRVYEIISIISVPIIARWCGSIVNNLPRQLAYAKYTDTILASRSSSFRRLIVGHVAYAQVKKPAFLFVHDTNETLRIRI